MSLEPIHDHTRVGRYELIRPLAMGGMAELHLARTVGPDGAEQRVVLKQILPQHLTSPHFVDMFVDEARVASQLRHPNIVQVLDVGRDGARRFIAMEYLQGRDLRAVMRALPRGVGLPIKHAIDVAVDICAGLHYAHELTDSDGRARNIVHRDISPQNVIVTFTGQVKIVDFGIAKASDRLTETRNGELKGKLRYMSPEQCRGEETDRRSDIFSTATLLWELTVGQKLFDGSSDFQVMKALTDGAVTPPSQRVADYPPELERIILRGLALDPRDRWATAEEMGRALRSLAEAHSFPFVAHSLSELMLSLFADDLETMPLALHLGGRSGSASDPHSAPTRVSLAGDGRPRLLTGRWLVLGVALAIAVTIGVTKRLRAPSALHVPAIVPTQPIAPPMRPPVPPPPLTSSPPPSPPPATPPGTKRSRHSHHKHHGSRRALSSDLDALME